MKPEQSISCGLENRQNMIRAPVPMWCWTCTHFVGTQLKTRQMEKSCVRTWLCSENAFWFFIFIWYVLKLCWVWCNVLRHCHFKTRCSSISITISSFHVLVYIGVHNWNSQPMHFDCLFSCRPRTSDKECGLGKCLCREKTGQNNSNQ